MYNCQKAVFDVNIKKNMFILCWNGTTDKRNIVSKQGLAASRGKPLLFMQILL